MADFQRERFAGINPALMAVLRGEKPETGRHFWEATKGASKDSDLAVCLLFLIAFTSRPLSCQVGAADADQADELRKAAKDILRLNPWLSGRITINNWRILCSATDSVCEIIAADVAGSHGARPDVLILNELSHVTKQEFAENLMDNAAKVPHGLAVIATNAGFTGTWQYRWRELARESDRWCFNVIAEPSPWLDPAEIEEARRRNSASRFMRLFHGVWASGQGDALDADDVHAAIDRELSAMTGDEPGYEFVAGLDLGISHDHSALCVLGCHYETRRIRLAECRHRRPGQRGKVDLEAVESAVFGHKLEATRDENGHADTAIALAIALPSATELLRDSHWDYDGPLIASGEDPLDESTPFTDEEIKELPDYLRDLVEGAKLQEKDRLAEHDYEDEGYEDVMGGY